MLIIYQGWKLEYISDWPSDEVMHTWTKYKMEWYKRFEPSDECLALLILARFAFVGFVFVVVSIVS